MGGVPSRLLRGVSASTAICDSIRARFAIGDVSRSSEVGPDPACSIFTTAMSDEARTPRAALEPHSRQHTSTAP
eukprot:scaffold212448_cov31-Tisochrysis_lutea.AAC.2